MAGYSGTPLPRKLGLRENARFAVVHPPAAFADALGALPPGVVPVVLEWPGRRPRRPTRAVPVFDVIVGFALSQAELSRLLPSLREQLAPTGGLWVAWPKKSSGVATDLTETQVRAAGLATGLVDNKVCAIDEVWSGLRFVVRLADRPR